MSEEPLKQVVLRELLLDFKSLLNAHLSPIPKRDHLLIYIKVLSIAIKAWSNINCRYDLDRGVKIYLYS